MCQGLFRMQAECPTCRLKFEREPGYFLGAIYINYAATVLCMLAGFFSLDYFFKPSLTSQIIVWSSFGVVFPILFYRHSKSLWLCLDYIFNPVEGDSVARHKPEITTAEHSPAVEIEDLRHFYADREALGGVSFSVAGGEMFALLGPNGGGKTTLFKILSTLMPPTSGTVRLWSHDLSREPFPVRNRLGVVFQHPSLDHKLTVIENLKHHGHLYGLAGRELQRRAQAMLARVGLTERANDLVETLSGGLQRRVELAKGLLHEPDMLVLDEPNTGLDPAARRDFMNYLQHLRDQQGVTILLTTHFMEDAERCDRVGILHEGKLVALGAPDALKQSIGGDIVVIQSPDPHGLQKKLRERFGCDATMVDGTLRVERPRGHEFIRDVVEAFPGEITSAAFGKPTLEDVFIHLTQQSYQ
ncbi:MAG TPA: ABC transporter ATP-binding protein [Candidatus Tectomicrobia bacterium]|nr:ABC transporter ATP-binding protein [Candidatus Tectomicrobia bacterium]